MTLAFTGSSEQADWLGLNRGAERSRVNQTLLLGPGQFAAHARVLILPDPQYPGQAEADQSDEVIDQLRADREILTDVFAVLRNATGTPDDLVFLLWDGWPWEPALPPAAINLADIRHCVVAEGSFGDWLDWTESGPETAFWPQFFWPRDRAWCVACDVDVHFAAVAADTTIIQQLAHDERLDVVVADWRVPQPYYRD